VTVESQRTSAGDKGSSTWQRAGVGVVDNKFCSAKVLGHGERSGHNGLAGWSVVKAHAAINMCTMCA
jgi:hypothetical protein